MRDNDLKTTLSLASEINENTSVASVADMVNEKTGLKYYLVHNIIEERENEYYLQMHFDTGNYRGLTGYSKPIVVKKKDCSIISDLDGCEIYLLSNKKYK